MLKEAIQEIASLQQAKGDLLKPFKFTQSADGRRESWYVNGQIVFADVTPALRNHTVKTVDDLVNAKGKWGTSGTIWIGPAAVVLVADDSDRRDFVRLPLDTGTTWDFLVGLPKTYTQAELIRHLRTTLVNASGRETLLTAVRKIRFKNHLTGASSVQHGNESMGQTIENEVMGAEAFPEGLTVDTYVYSNLGETDYKFSVALQMEIDAKNQKFILMPEGDEIERVSQAALASIRERIEKTLPNAAVFYGSP